MSDRLLAVAPPRDDGLGAGSIEVFPEPVRIAAAAGHETVEASGPGEKLRGGTDVAVVAGREVQHDRPAEQVGDQMDLRPTPASGYANGLIFRLFFWAPAADRGAFTCVLSIATVPPIRPCSTKVS